MKALDALLKYDNIAPVQVFRTYGGDICVEYRDSYVEGCNAPIRTYGLGKTLEKACEVYLKQIDGKTMGFYDPDGGIKILTVNFKEEMTDKIDSNIICRKAIDKYGKVSQITVAFEEMAELAKELSKNLRGRDNVAEIAEEIADVQIMLSQMMILFDCGDMVEDMKAKKLERLNRRIENE